MKKMFYKGVIRPDEFTKDQLLSHTLTVIKFLEINGESKQARKYAKQVEKLEQRIIGGAFRN